MAESKRYDLKIQEVPEDERPRERLKRNGAQALSLSELLAILLRTGNGERSALSLADHIIAEMGGLKGLASKSHADFCKINGIGPAKASELLAAIELGKRLAIASDRAEQRKIMSPKDVADLLMPEMRDLQQENFCVLILDTKNRVIKKSVITVGLLDSAPIHPREVFREAISLNASSIIAVHNHPSGDPTPSASDVQATKTLVEAGRTLGIDVVDHIVIGHNRWISLKELNYI